MRTTRAIATSGRLGLGPACFFALACGAPPSPAPSTRPAHVEPAPEVARGPVVEHVSVTLGRTTDGVALDSLDGGDASRVGRADLRIGEAAFSVPIPGCGRGGGWGWSVEHADPGPSPWARVLRTPEVPATDGEDQAPHEIGITGSLVGFDHRVTPQRIELREGGAVYFTFTTSHPAVGEGSPQPGEHLFEPGRDGERALGAQVLTLALGTGRLLGCPTVRLTLLDPRSQIVDVTDGGTGTVRPFARLRLGDVSIRWEGVGQARRIDGDVMMLFFEGSAAGSAEEAFSCTTSAPCRFRDVAIEPVALQDPGPQSTFRLTRTTEAAPAP